MKYVVSISILLLLSKSFFAQRDEVNRDTIVYGKLFHVIMYNETNHVACVGNYITNTFIRTGEWDYFYNDGKLFSQTFFKIDAKIGIWVFYDEQGNITEEMNTRKKIKEEEVPITSVFYEDEQQNKDAFNEQYETIRPYAAAMLNYTFYRYVNRGHRYRYTIVSVDFHKKINKHT